MTKPKAAALAVAAILLILLAAACAGGSETSVPGGVVTFDVSVSDPVNGDSPVGEFEPARFTVSPGQQVTFNLINNGVAVHTMRIAGRDNKYETDDDAIVEPYVVASGASGVLTWIAPKRPGIYNFRCDFHPKSTGTIVVE